MLATTITWTQFKTPSKQIGVLDYARFVGEQEVMELAAQGMRAVVDHSYGQARAACENKEARIVELVNNWHPHFVGVGFLPSSMLGVLSRSEFSSERIDGPSASKTLHIWTKEILNSSSQPDWMKLVVDRHAEITSDVLSITAKSIFRELLNARGGEVDLSRLPDEAVNGMHLAIVLRATFSNREQTKGWDAGLKAARRALSRDGLDEYDALMGLL